MFGKFNDSNARDGSARSPSKPSNTRRINREITATKIRVVGSDGQMLGVFSRDEALGMAAAENLDLVEISQSSEESVCKLLNYSKFVYENRKKSQDVKRKGKIIKVKEIKVRPNIGENDYNIKLKNAREFLDDGHKVKFTIRLRGREMLFKDLALDMLNKFKDDLSNIAKPDSPLKKEGTQFQLMFTANKSPTS